MPSYITILSGLYIAPLFGGLHIAHLFLDIDIDYFLQMQALLNTAIFLDYRHNIVTIAYRDNLPYCLLFDRFNRQLFLLKNMTTGLLQDFVNFFHLFSAIAVVL